MIFDLITVTYISASVFITSLIGLTIYYKADGIHIWRDDPNKPYSRKVLTGGGLPIIIVISIFYIIFIWWFPNQKLLFVGISITTLIGMLLGLLDEFKDIKIWKKVPLMLIPPLPLAAIALIHPFWSHTYILWIDFGIFYWLFVIPIVYMGFSNGANIIAGYDGLEAGVYLLILILYIIIGTILNNITVLLLSIPLFFALFAFEFFNVPPSKLLLGNVGSFPIGGLLGVIPLIGHFEIVLPIVFLPHLVEFLFKIKYKGHTSVFGKVDTNGIIHNIDGIKSVLHWIISWGNMTEKEITLAMLGIETLLCITAFGVWYLAYSFNFI